MIKVMITAIIIIMIMTHLILEELWIENFSRRRNVFCYVDRLHILLLMIIIVVMMEKKDEEKRNSQQFSH